MRTRQYVHGTSSIEQKRLALLNRLVNPGSLAALEVRRGERILEVGSGLGDFSRAMARSAGARGRVLGIEKSLRQLRRARRRTAPDRLPVEFRQGDARRLPLSPQERGSFDTAHARFLLEHLPRPLEAVRQMVQAVRQGGRIVLEDDDHDLLRLYPEPPGFARLWRAYVRGFALHGNDPFIGRKLPSLLLDAGAVPTRCTAVFFGSCSPAPDFPGFHENLVRVLAGARRTILQSGLLTSDSLTDALRSLRAWARLPSATIWYSICWASGRRVR